MQRSIVVLAVLGFSIGAVQAQSADKSVNLKQASPGTTGALSNVNKDGIATDPGGVAAQQGANTKSSPGTVGAAPGADTASQTMKK